MGPAAAHPPGAPPQTDGPGATGRGDSGRTSDRDAGTSRATPGASPHSTDPTPKTTRPARKTRLRPRSSASRPVVTRRAPKTTAEALSTHESPARVTWGTSAVSAGKAMLTRARRGSLPPGGLRPGARRPAHRLGRTSYGGLVADRSVHHSMAPSDRQGKPPVTTSWTGQSATVGNPTPSTRRCPVPRDADPGLRRRILDAAAPLFSARGIQAVGTAEVAAAAGCGKNVLYREFPGKDLLVRAYLEEFADARRRAQDAAVAGLEADPGAALVALTADAARRMLHPRFQGCALRNYLREFHGPEGAPGEVASAGVAATRTRLDDLALRTGATDPQALADEVWLVWEGLWASAPYGDRQRLGERAVALVGDLVSGSVRPAS